jgi:hypothetical protein
VPSIVKERQRLPKKVSTPAAVLMLATDPARHNIDVVARYSLAQCRISPQAATRDD